VYCQNYPWSQQGRGDRYAEPDLVRAFRNLARAGCHNWNLVSPTPWLPLIRKAIETARRDGISLPVVYNTSGFERVETLREFGDLADIFLTDLRYSRNTSALELSAAPAYVETARAALREMWIQAGPLEFDSGGLAIRGTICRLLILPGHAHEAIENLKWLAATIGTEIAISLMAQYAPAYRAGELTELSRTVTENEYESVVRAMEQLGFTSGWIQELDRTTDPGLLGFEMAAGADPGICQLSGTT
jgi:putative pyruvate formate lyase activating enzyme